jgi:hypothetical protein
MNSSNFKPGDILLATHRENKKKHPIIYLSGYSDFSFLRARLTNHPELTRNIKIDASCFTVKNGYEKYVSSARKIYQTCSMRAIQKDKRIEF